jgi:hypothetical protein
MESKEVVGDRVLVHMQNESNGVWLDSAESYLVIAFYDKKNMRKSIAQQLICGLTDYIEDLEEF